MRRIKKARIRFVSLLDRGASQLPVLYKSEDQHAHFDTLIKDDQLEEGELTAVVYAPELRDSDGDIASAEVIKDMAHDYMRSGAKVDVTHNFEELPKDAAYVAESFIVQKGDSRFSEMRDYSGNPVDVTGGWAMVIKIDDPELRRLYREGKWNGVSMWGPALVEDEVQKSDRILDELAKRLGLADQGEFDMDEKTLVEALEKSQAPVLDALKGLTEALTPKKGEVTEETPTKVEKSEEKVAFEGDPSNPEDLKKHLAKVRKAELMKSGDLDDPAKLEALLEAAAEEGGGGDGGDGSGEGEGTVQKSEDPKIAELEKQLAQLKKQKRGSKVPDGGGGDPAGPNQATLSKSEQAGLKHGRRMAEYINARRGFKKVG